MKLLKVLATGAVALAVSTNVMAQSGPQGRSQGDLARGIVGALVDAGHIMVAPNLVFAMSGSGDSLHVGRFSDTAADMGPFGSTPDGSKSSDFSLMQSYNFNSQDASAIPSDMAAGVCRGVAGAGYSASFLPSIWQLEAMAANKAKFVVGFNNDQSNPFSQFFKVSAAVRTVISNNLANIPVVELISSTQDPDNNANVLSLKTDGTRGSVSKTATDSNFICLSKYKAAQVAFRASKLSS